MLAAFGEGKKQRRSFVTPPSLPTSLFLSARIGKPFEVSGVVPPDSPTNRSLWQFLLRNFDQKRQFFTVVLSVIVSLLPGPDSVLITESHCNMKLICVFVSRGVGRDK